MNLNKKNLYAALIIFLLCIITYGNTLHNGFLMDDYNFLLNEDNLQSVTNCDLIKNGFKGTYRPTGLVLLKYELLAFGSNPQGYHLTNILLFFIIGWLFYILLDKIFYNFKLALIPSAMYVVHPINNFLINYKTASGLSLFIIFMQLSFLLFLKFYRNKRISNYFFSISFYFLALFSHEASFILPLFIFFFLLFSGNFKIQKNVLLCLPYAIPLSVYLIIHSITLHTRRLNNILGVKITFYQYINTLMELLSWYISKLIVPINILFTWDVRLGRNELILTNFIIPLIILILVIFLFFKIKNGYKSFAFVLFAIGLVPAFLFCFGYTYLFQTAAIEPHWFGFSSIGFFIILSSLLISFRKYFGHKLWILFIVVLLLSFSLLTRKDNSVWKNADTFCSYWLNENSVNGSAWHCKAVSYIKNSDKGNDIEKYENCNQLSFLGVSYHIIGNSRRTFEYYKMALKKNDNCALAYYGLGLLYSDMGNFELADMAVKKAVEIEPAYLPVYNLSLKLTDEQRQINSARNLKKLIDRINEKKWHNNRNL